ncbi:hypothetical protein IEQ34_010967 [Dendrobium chrysotoxum]|uniref:Uncharacterized protein n=1 Tax=Dendrobium chrysotoxum TaxID=161865 RepID=A0AAV7GEX0_DENCH|nr:hypothetical protein IEQ34_010967 [Dendrobium chrysotoxum]
MADLCLGYIIDLLTNAHVAAIISNRVWVVPIALSPSLHNSIFVVSLNFDGWDLTLWNIKEVEQWWIGQQRERFHYKSNAKISWEEFVETFGANARVLFKIDTREQDGDAVRSRVHNTFQLVNTLKEKCYMFLYGLRDSLRNPLVLFHISDFFELVKRDRLVENDLMSTHHFSISLKTLERRSLKKVQFSAITRRVRKDGWFSVVTRRVKKDDRFFAVTWRVKKDDGSLPHWVGGREFVNASPPCCGGKRRVT